MEEDSTILQSMTRMTKVSLLLKTFDKTLSRRRMRVSNKIKNSMTKVKTRGNKLIKKKTKSSILEGLRWTFSRREQEISS